MPLSLNYLASHSRNLESLLQTYRQIDLTSQSVFLVLGTFLMSRIMETQSVFIALILEIVLIVLIFFSNIVMRRFQSVIRARGEDVNWWHKKIIMTEQEYPPEERAFTEFKIEQNRDRVDSEFRASILDPSSPITDEQIHMLLDADLKHIRKIINTYIYRAVTIMWSMLFLISMGGLIIRWMVVP